MSVGKLGCPSSLMNSWDLTNSAAPGPPWPSNTPKKPNCSPLLHLLNYMHTRDVMTRNKVRGMQHGFGSSGGCIACLREREVLHVASSALLCSERVRDLFVIPARKGGVVMLSHIRQTREHDTSRHSTCDPCMVWA